MRPTVLIIEARPEVGSALKAVIEALNITAMVVPHLDTLNDLEVTPSAILVRIALDGSGDPPHAVLGRLPASRPPVVALAWEEEEVEEARRLKCDVVLQLPAESWRLGETLRRLVQARA